MEAMRLMRAVFLVALSFVLVTFSAIDIDGDPTTTNLPSVALNCSADLDAERPEGRSDVPPEDSPPAVLRARLSRRLQQWMSQRGQELHLRALSIRGP
jgi:hypothetical protein